MSTPSADNPIILTPRPNYAGNVGADSFTGGVDVALYSGWSVKYADVREDGFGSLSATPSLSDGSVNFFSWSVRNTGRGGFIELTAKKDGEADVKCYFYVSSVYLPSNNQFTGTAAVGGDLPADATASSLGDWVTAGAVNAADNTVSYSVSSRAGGGGRASGINLTGTGYAGAVAIFQGETDCPRIIPLSEDVSSTSGVDIISFVNSTSVPTVTSSAGWLRWSALTQGGLTYHYDSNAGDARVGYLMIYAEGVTNTFQLNQAAAAVAPTITPESGSVSSLAGEGSITLNNFTGVPTVTSNADWITIASSSSLSVFYTYSANSGNTSRDGTITIVSGDDTFTFALSQAGAPAVAPTLTPVFASVGATGGSGAIAVNNCQTTPTASSNVNWLAVDSVTSSSIAYSYSANYGVSSRDGIISVTADGTSLSFTLTQSAAAEPPIVVPPPYLEPVSDRGFTSSGSDSFLVYNATSVPYVTTSEPWLRVLEVVSTGVAGEYSVRYGYDRNTSWRSDRTAYVVVSLGANIILNFRFIQPKSDKYLSFSYPSFPESPFVGLPASEGSYSINIESNLDWTLSSGSDWIVFDRLYGSGDSVVTFRVLKNLSTDSRNAYLIASSEEWSSSDPSVSVSQVGAVSPVGEIGDNMRLMPFQFSSTDSYSLLLLEIGGSVYVRIYSGNSGELLSEIETEFPAGNLYTIDFQQCNDVVFFAHPSVRPQKLERKTNTAGDGYVFELKPHDLICDPVLDWNVDGDTQFVLTSTGVTDQETSASVPVGSIVAGGGVGIIESAVGDYSYDSLSGFMTLELSVVFMESTRLVVGKTYNLVGVVASFLARGNKYTITEDPNDGNLLEPFSYNFDYSNPACECIETNAEYATFKLGLYNIKEMVLGTVIGATSTIDSLEIVVNPVSLTDSAGIEGSAEPAFYKVKKPIIDGVGFDNEEYFEKSCCVGDKLYLYDVANKFFDNGAWRVGQTFALQRKKRYVVSGDWNYIDYPLAGSNPGGWGLSSEWIPAYGNVTLKTSGKSDGIFILEELPRSGEVREIGRIVIENAGSNGSIIREIDTIGSLVRVRCIKRSKAYTKQAVFVGLDSDLEYRTYDVDTGCQWELSCDSVSEIYMKIESVRQNDNFGVVGGVGRCWTAEVRMLSGISSPLRSSTWAEGAWCGRYGFPRAVKLFQERLAFAGNIKSPATVWLSKTNYWDDFMLGTRSNSACSFTLLSDSLDEIKWLLSKDSLVIGTAGGEWVMQGTGGAVLTATNVDVKKRSSYGSTSCVPAVLFDNTVVLAKSGAREVRSLTYDMVSENFGGGNLSLFANHLFDSGVKELMVARAPNTMLYAVMNDGKFLSFTYDTENSVFGWAEHTILDGVKTACVVRRGDVDVICIVAHRGAHFDIGYIDPTSTTVWQDDGTDYESVLEPMPLRADNGSMFGGTVVIAGLEVYMTQGAKFNVQLSGDPAEYEAIAGFDTSGHLKQIEYKHEVPVGGNWADEASVVLWTSYPAPWVVTAIGASVIDV